MAGAALVGHDGVVRRLLILLCAAAVYAVTGSVTASHAMAEFTQWFDRSVGGATQVL